MTQAFHASSFSVFWFLFLFYRINIQVQIDTWQTLMKI